MAATLPRNSTNVRNDAVQPEAATRRRWVADVPRTLAVALALAAFVAAAAWDAGLIDRLDGVERAVIAAFGAVVVVLVLGCDAELRAALARSRAFRTTAAKSPGAKRAAT